MNKEIAAKALEIAFIGDVEEEIENIIWAESSPSGISSEINKNSIVVYYPPERFPAEDFIEKLKSLCSIRSIKRKTIYKRDWNKKWQKGMQPVWIGEDMVVLPPFKAKVRGFEAKKKIIINPAMAFGTGHHESTQGIMKLMDRHSGLFNGRSVADFGCGSGILSIFSRMLNSKEVDAYDFDPECREAVRENIRLNRVEGINFYQERIERCEKRYDILLVNMLFGEIMENRKVIIRSLRKKGYLFLLGILNIEKGEILKAFKNFEPLDELVLNDWISLLLKKI